MKDRSSRGGNRPWYQLWGASLMLDVLGDLVLLSADAAEGYRRQALEDEAYIDSVVRDLLAELDLDLSWTPPNPGVSFA